MDNLEKIIASTERIAELEYQARQERAARGALVAKVLVSGTSPVRPKGSLSSTEIAGAIGISYQNVQKMARTFAPKGEGTLLARRERDARRRAAAKTAKGQ